MGKKKLRPGTVVYILLFILGMILLVGQFRREEQTTELRRLRFFGEYSRDGETWHPYEGQALSAVAGELYLRGDFGMQIPEGSLISFHAFHIRAEVEFNGEPLYTMGSDAQCNSTWVHFRTPYVGPRDRFTIHLSNAHLIGNAHSYMQLLDGIYLGERDVLRRTVETQDVSRRITGIAVIALSLILMAMILVFRILYPGVSDRILPISLMAFCYGGYLLFSSPSVTMGVGWPSLIPFALFGCVIVALLELSLLLRKFLTAGRQIASNILLTVQIIYLVFLMLWNILGGPELCRLLDLWIPVQMVALVILLALGAWEWFFYSGRYPGLLACSGIILIAALLEGLNEFLLLWDQRLILDVVVALFFSVYAIYGIVRVPLSFRMAAQTEKLKSDLQQSRIVLAMSQIRAHFIFNLLNAISGMSKYDPEKADATLIRFARYLRGNIDVMQEDRLESFRSTLHHLEDYIALEQVRFGDRIRFRTEIGFSDFNIPPLVLQPLVENAIKHGLMNKAEGGTITLSTRRSGDHVVITVADDGVGFSVEAPGNKSSVGLSNVRFRLEQLADGHMELESTPGEGTVVTVTIPVPKGKEREA